MNSEPLPVRWARDDVAARPEQVTPELALVDPVLRRRLLEQASSEALDLPRRLAARRLTLAPEPVAEPDPVAEAAPAAVAPNARRGRVRSLALFGVAASVAFVLGVLVYESHLLHIGKTNVPTEVASTAGDSIQVAPSAEQHIIPTAQPHPRAPKSPGVASTANGSIQVTPSAEQHTIPTAQPQPRASKSPAAPTSPREPAAGVRHFAWAPTPGATAYEVALYKGNARVFRARTLKPALDLTVGLARSRTSKSVAPGTYEWYVWAIVNGQRSPAAVVRSRLVLTSS